MSATANDVSVTVSTVGSSYIELNGSVSSGVLSYGTPVSGCGSCTNVSHGTLSDFNSATGVLTYTPNSGFTGTDTFTYTAIQDGSTTSSAATVTITVTSAKTAVSDYILNPDGSSRGGTVTFILTQQATSGDGLIPGSSTVSATVDASTGLFSASLYPSEGLSPQAYYQLWWGSTSNLRRELLGVYNIPASASTITLSTYKVTDANLAARYTFVSKAGFAAFNARTFAVQVLNNGSSIGTRGAINFIPGSNISYTIADNSGSGRVDVTINGPAGGGTGGTVSSGSIGKLAVYAATGTTVSGLALGTANQVLGMNSGASAHEYKTVTAGTGISVSHGTNAITIANSGVTSINGSSVAAQVIQIGTNACGSVPGVSSALGTTTICIPLASTTAGGYVSVGTQTIAGAKTLTGDGASDTPLTLKQSSGGSSVLQSWQDSSATVYGNFSLNGGTATSGLYANKLAAGTSGAVTTGYVFYLSNASSSEGESAAGALINNALTANSTSSNLRGMFLTYSLDGTGTHSGTRSAALDANFTFTGSGTLTSVSAVRGMLTNDDTGTVTNARVFYSTGTFSGGGTITNLSHFYVAAPSVSSTTFTNQYGLYIESLTAATNNYAIYAAGTAGSSLGGAFDLRGRTAPSVSNSGEVRLYSDTSGVLKISGNGAAYGTVPVFLTGSAALDFGSTAAQSSSELTITVTGAVAGKPVFLGIPTASVNANTTYTARVSAADTVSVTFINFSSGSVNPASGTFTVLVQQ